MGMYEKQYKQVVLLFLFPGNGFMLKICRFSVLLSLIL